jgi:hypothetical protein
MLFHVVAALVAAVQAGDIPAALVQFGKLAQLAAELLGPPVVGDAFTVQKVVHADDKAFDDAVAELTACCPAEDHAPEESADKPKRRKAAHAAVAAINPATLAVIVQAAIKVLELIRERRRNRQ